MDYKFVLSKITALDPHCPMIQVLLDDPEIGDSLKLLLNQAVELEKQMDDISNQISKLCRLHPQDWDENIEKTIQLETGNDHVAAQKTRMRMGEIQEAVRTALEQGLGPSDIRAIVEVMVMGMQEGFLNYLYVRQENHS